MSDPDFSLEDVTRYWDDNAVAWAREVRQGHDVAREFMNNPALLGQIAALRRRRLSLRDISRTLAARGILARNGRPFGPSTILGLVRNPAVANTSERP
jgi:hypothetical protein